MEQVSTGRRRSRSRSGAVSVAELIRRQPHAGDDLGLADEQLASASECAEEPSSPLAMRITVGVLGATLMCGSAGAASMIITRPPAVSPRHAPSAEPIHGVQALRPDLLRQAHWPFRENGGYATARTDDTGDDDQSGQHSQSPLSRMTSANPSAGSTGSAVRLVRDFYDLLDKDPARAAGLLAPELLGQDHGELASAWDELTSVRQLTVEAQPDGSVIAEVAAEHPDGGRLILRHQFTINLGTQPKIVDAHLLAARYTPGNPQ